MLILLEDLVLSKSPGVNRTHTMRDVIILDFDRNYLLAILTTFIAWIVLTRR